MKKFLAIILVTAMLLSTVSVFSLGAFAAMPSASVLGGYENIVLTYTFQLGRGDKGRHTVDDLMPYVAYLDANGNIKDTFFDGYLFLPQNSNGPTGSRMHYVSGYSTKAQDWTEYVTDTFVSGYNVSALNTAYGKVKSTLGSKAKDKVGVFFTILYPAVESGSGFGSLGGRTLNFNKMEDRKYAVKWIIDEQISLYKAGGYSNLELVGFYWLEEYLYSNTDKELFTYASNYLHSLGLKFIWIPYYNASGYTQWSSLGFDFASLQPNYYFGGAGGSTRVATSNNLSKTYGMGVEMEVDNNADTSKFYNRYLEYLDVGRTSGAMKSIKTYYQDGKEAAFYNACYSRNPVFRSVYDLTYKYAKGTITASDIDYNFAAQYDPVDTINVENNVALGKSYTTSLLYRQSASTGWAYDPSAPIAYPDSGGELTDGKIPDDGAYQNERWVGLHNSTPDIAQAGMSGAWVDVDLGKQYDITKVILYLPTANQGAAYNSAYITLPNSIRIYTSDDGSNWESVSSLNRSQILAQDGNVSYFVSGVAVDVSATTRYVRAEFVTGGWSFISEIAVIGTTASNTYPKNPTKKVTTEHGAIYYNYSSYGAVSKTNANINVIRFSGADGLFPMAYAADAGNASYLKDHVNSAIADGYTVVGAINASFFDMTTYDPNNKLISDGKIVFDHADYPDVLTAFYEDGSSELFGSVDIDYALTIGNYTISTDAIGMVNKRYSAPVSWTKNSFGVDISNRFHYYDSDMGNLADGTSQTGYEILCQKHNDTEIAIGQTLKGKVLSVTSGYYGKTKVTADDEFVLFVNTNSPYAAYAKSLSAGASVSLTPTCNSTYITTQLSKADSAVSSTYWLVRDGVDITDTASEIVHSTTLSRAWTAFGWDNDGNYYFFVNEEYGLTLKDVADEMIKMGCTNVLRVDGGGSTTMWVEGEGIVENAGNRRVVDCILIVKRNYTATPGETVPDGSEKIALRHNVAYGKSYTTSGLYRQGGADVDWAYDASKEIAYPDENNSSLTDGYIAAYGDYHNAAWAGFHAGTPDAKAVGYSWIKIDLDNNHNIDEIIVYGPCAAGLGDGVNSLDKVEFYDGETGAKLGTATASDYNEVTAEYTIQGNFNVRIVEVRIYGFAWHFVSEIAIYGTLDTSCRHDYGAFIKEPTCTEQGYTKFTCKLCAESYIDNYTNALGHDMGDWYVITAGSCIAEGAQRRDCRRCEHYETSKTTLSDHDYKAVVTAPTCTSQGYTTYTCTVCGHSYESHYTDILPHTPGTDADCEHDQICTSCGIVMVKATGHKADDTWYNNANSHWHKCVVCKKMVEVSSHDSGKWRIVTPAQVGVEGERALCCTACEYVLASEKIPALEPDHVHSPVTDWYDDESGHWKLCSCGTELEYATHTPGAEADCVNDQICTVCEYVIVKAEGHDYTTVVTAPTCTSQGYTIYMCSKCDDIHADDFTDMIPHTPGAKADCEHDQTCTVCGTVLEKAHGHRFQWVVTKEAEIGVEGEREYMCPDCGTVEKTETIPALTEDDDWVLGDVNKNGQIDMTDYIMVKRAYFGTLTFDEDQKMRGDCNQNGQIDMTDYIMVKRAYFGTLVLEKKK